MSDNHESGPVEASDVFYPEDKAEPLKPTAELDDENTDEIPSDDIEDTEVEAELADDAGSDDVESDAEESEDEEGDDEPSEEEDALYLDLDGEEHSLDEIREMKKSHDAGKLMQADYTKKTQVLADDRRALDTERTAFNETVTKVRDLSVELEAMVAEDEEIDWVELKQIDPEEYIDKKEKADKRKAKVAELKLALPASNVMSDADIAAEQKVLLTLMPTWIKDGKPTAAYQEDVKAAFEYAKGEGYTDEYLNNLHDAHHWKALVTLSKGGEVKKGKLSAIDKKVKKAPLVTRPKKSVVKKTKSAEDLFYG